MTPVETLLSVANLLACFVLAVRLPRAVRWMRHSAPIALPMAIAQVLVEGPLWQCRRRPLPDPLLARPFRDRRGPVRGHRGGDDRRRGHQQPRSNDR